MRGGVFRLFFCKNSKQDISFKKNSTSNILKIPFVKNLFKNYFTYKNKQNYFYHLRHHGESVFKYDFMMSLNEKDYPYYLSEAYLIKTGEKLNLLRPKTLNEKIQWIKIYDNNQQKRELTDKVLVRDWVRNTIGEIYLKTALWIGDKFDDIPFESLPVSFIIKCNHGCKWHVKVRNKQEFLNNRKLFDSCRMYINSWLNQSFFGWSDFETQYKNINPKIIIEPLLLENLNESADEIEVWCFNGIAKIIQKCRNVIINNKFSHRQITSFDGNFNQNDIKFYYTNEIIHAEADEIIKQAKELSENLAKGFKFVRVDWMIYQNKIYFCEMTFTPHSGFIFFIKNHNELQIKLGKMLNLKGNKYE